jgi:hypothetical protein
LYIGRKNQGRKSIENTESQNLSFIGSIELPMFYLTSNKLIVHCHM